MLFNTYEFIFLFLPITLLVYFSLHRWKLLLPAKVWLVAASLFFYGYWSIYYVPLLLFSMTSNYFLGSWLEKNAHTRQRKIIMTVGIVFNVCMLIFFKYMDFLISTVNSVAGTQAGLLHILMPLAISFITFQKVAYLIDMYKREVKQTDFLTFSLFVLFFPQLISGPIVFYQEMMPQFASLRQKIVNMRHLIIGITIFTIGLSKKVLLADTFAKWANFGYSHIAQLELFDSWMLAIIYMFQHYFDFSGYTDMAIGLALMLNVHLPQNFNSPYQATSISDFWKRWHMTLTRFFRKYIYFPLGGSRRGASRTYLNILIIFLISGFWHGAAWTFVFWGLLNGAAMIFYLQWQKLNIRMYVWLAWAITFAFVTLTRVFYRSETFSDAWHVISAMFGFQGVSLRHSVFEKMPFQFFIDWGLSPVVIGWLFVLLGFVLVLGFQNTIALKRNFKPNFWNMLGIAVLCILCILQLNHVSEFIYYQF